MVGPRFLLPVFAAGALLASVVSARADSLRADFSPLTLRPRTNAPAIFHVKLHRAGAGLLEGVLEIVFEANGEVVLRQRTQDLALAAGAQSFRIITPPLPPHESYTGTEARLRFVTKAAAVDLGRFPVEAASRGTRNFVIAVCDGGLAGRRDVALWQSLRLENVLPAAAVGQNSVATAPAFLAPEDFPANPLALFAFDLVLLDGDGFALLREKQLTALTRWVEAGGSVCVLPGRGLKEEHVRFLNAFVEPRQAALFKISEVGELTAPVGEPQLRRGGLGRVVISSRPADEVLTGPGWLQAAAHLWKVREGNLLGEKSAIPSAAHQRYIRSGGNDGRSARRQSIEQLLATLLPQSTRLISPGTLALVLAGFLVVVGPLDWLVLGALRRRRWTWFVFPLAAAGFTALVIFEAGRALGRQDNLGTLTITDVGPAGRTLRASRFELLLAARDREVTTEVQHAFAAPAGLGSADFGQRGGGNRATGSNADATSFAGQIPARYTLRQQVRQWTPQFNRITTLDAAPDAVDALPWAEIDAALAAGGRTPDVALRPVAMKHPALGLYLFTRENVFLTPVPSPPLPPGVAELCRGSKSGLGALLARTSPDAAGDFADLPVLDTSDPDEWLLVISRQTPKGVHFYRRLFRTDAP